MYLDIEQLPQNISNVCIQRNFNCLQTCTNSTQIGHLNNSRTGLLMFWKTTLKLLQLYNITSDKKCNIFCGFNGGLLRCECLNVILFILIYIVNVIVVIEVEWIVNMVLIHVINVYY